MNKKHFTLALGGLLVLVLAIFGCTEDAGSIFVDKSEYLSVNHPIDFNQLSTTEKETVLKAFSRLTLKTSKNGYITIKQESGKEVNISENIYAFYKNLLDQHNKTIPLKITTRMMELNDSDAVGGMEEEVDSSGCVIYSIQGVMQEMGKSIGYDEIKNNLVEKGLFNNGVAYYNMYSALNQYFTVSYEYPPYDQAHNPGKHYIMSVWQDVSNQEREYHSVVFLSSNDGQFVYYDYQNKCLGTCSINNVFQFFQVSEKH